MSTSMFKVRARTLPIFAGILLSLAIALVGCGKAAPSTGGSGSGGSSSGGGTTSDTIYMNSTNFTVHSITVSANQPVKFSDTVGGGGLHIICVGTGTGGTNTCLKSGNVPASLLGKGTTFNPGDTKDFTFTTPGTYRVICIVHPGMYIDIVAK